MKPLTIKDWIEELDESIKICEEIDHPQAPSYRLMRASLIKRQQALEVGMRGTLRFKVEYRKFEKNDDGYESPEDFRHIHVSLVQLDGTHVRQIESFVGYVGDGTGEKYATEFAEKLGVIAEIELVEEKNEKES